jgi:hypothetical protein
MVNADILRLSADGYLYMNAYTAKMFDAENIFLTENGIQEGHSPVYLFAENPDQIRAEEVEKVILYHWNRSYPADQYFPLDLSTWTKTETVEFAGYSHEKITRETFGKQKRVEK